MKNISKIILLLTLFLSSMSIKGQFSIYNKGADSNIEKINIDSTFYSSSNIYEIYDSSISGLCVTADIELYNYEKRHGRRLTTLYLLMKRRQVS